jgi:WD40 repeat protein
LNDLTTTINRKPPKDLHPQVLTIARPDGATLATASGDQTVRLWDVATGAARGGPLVGHKGLIRAVAFSPDGKLLASAGEDDTIRLWDVQTGKPTGRRWSVTRTGSPASRSTRTGP